MIRLTGNSLVEPIRPTTRLISCTNYVVGTLISLWVGSRFPKHIDAGDVQIIYEGHDSQIISRYLLTGEFDAKHNIDAIKQRCDLAKYLCECYPEYAGDKGVDYYNVIKTVAKNVIDANLPPSDAILFTFEMDNANVAWREQIVRGRGNQNFWTQTSRSMDLTTIDIHMSESIEHYGGQEGVKIYKDTVDTMRQAYKKLVELGVPIEDIRLVPPGMTHRVFWMVNLRTLLTIIQKRMSWLAQASLWSPIIEDIVGILNQDEVLDSKIGVPIDVKVKDGKIIAHYGENDNEDRYQGKDPQPTDPAYLAYKGLSMPEHTDIKFYDTMKSYYIKLWSKEFCDILGWDKENPSKLGPYDRPKTFK